MATYQNSALNIIKRSAIDAAGRLGSLYDGYRDCMLGHLNVRDIGKSYETPKSVRCRVITGETNKKRNLLRLVDIEDELQLSILLNLTSKTGIASLMDYSYPIDEFIRILHYSYVYVEERFLDNDSKFQQSIQPLMPLTSATHIVTGVTWGINIVVILQLPSEVETIKKIDGVLEKIQNALEHDKDNLTFERDDENLLDTIIDTKIYCNVLELARMTTLNDVCRHIDQFKNGIINYPMTYTLRSITSFYAEYTEQGATFVTLPSAITDIIIKHVLQISSSIKNLETSLNENLPKVLGEYLKWQHYDIHKQWSDVNKIYMDEIHRLSKLLINCRNGHIKIAALKEALSDDKQLTLKKNMNDLRQNIKSLETKGQLITDLHLQQLKYCNVVERGIDENDTTETIERKLIMDEQRDRVLCTNDILNENNLEQLTQLRGKLVKECEKNPALHLIYADFSYTSFNLKDMIILPSVKIDDDQNQPTQKNISSSIVAQLPSTSHTDTINILLLGETGVGKSTFINAFVNYLTFDSLQTAESNEPVVLIPVSFAITVGDNFNEYIVEFDNIHKSDDEHFNSFGQSVTQHCRSYILHLKNSNGKKLRIIDTPGFGDTRGCEQDDHNMKHILEYINSLTHLNAICFLLKPDAAQLNMFFQSCITQLVDHLGPNVGENIIFCFTNARVTFFTPGSTAPLLKTMLTSLSMDNIPFKKENTFCFDSESFRYLVALLKKVPFNDLNKSEYEQSWLTSIKESNRLMDYIHQSLPTHRMQYEQQSIKNAQFAIMHMIRPMLEAIRNILRNIILCMLDSQNNSIELHPKILYRLATECLSCRLNPIQVGNFWILPDVGHEIQNKCLTCSCASDQHRPMEYMLEYEYSSNISNFDELKNMLHSLFDASVEFAHFLMHVTHSTKNDAFFTGFNRMLKEEKDISEKVQPNEYNVQLVQQLEIVSRDYKERMDKTRVNQLESILSNINDRIKTITECPMVCQQMNAIKKGQVIMMKHYEYVC